LLSDPFVARHLLWFQISVVLVKRNPIAEPPLVRSGESDRNGECKGALPALEKFSTGRRNSSAVPLRNPFDRPAFRDRIPRCLSGAVTTAPIRTAAMRGAMQRLR